jgi:hypothetical protein
MELGERIITELRLDWPVKTKGLMTRCVSPATTPAPEDQLPVGSLSLRSFMPMRVKLKANEATAENIGMKILHIHKAHVLSLLMVIGCVSTGVDLVEQYDVKVEYVPSQYAYPHGVSVRQEEKMLIISGELQERPSRVGFVPGHVDIKVISLDGDVLQQGYTTFHRVGSRKSGKFEFSIQFPGTISQVSKIRVGHDPRRIKQEPQILRPPHH